MRKKEVFNVCLTAMMISLAVVFELVSKFVLVLKMPNGGGISIAMLPLVVCSVVCGFKYGLISGIIYGLLDCFLLDGYAFNLASFILDYMIAYMSVNLASIFSKKILEGKRQYFIFAYLIVMGVRFLSCGLSGVINAEVWGYDQAFLEGMFGEGNASIWWLFLYSYIIYNLPYLGVTTIVSIAVGLIGYKVIFLKLNEYGIERDK